MSDKATSRGLSHNKNSELDLEALLKKKIRRWSPHYVLTPKAGAALMEIEAAKTLVEVSPLPLVAAEELRRRARLRSTHFSTRIEGNRLSLAEAERAIDSPRVVFKGRERDVTEVRNYWEALLRIERWAAEGKPLTEDLIRRIHGFVMNGPHSKPTHYRDGQNAIREAGSGSLIYLPPEAKDVPGLMSGLVGWITWAERNDIPVPALAGLAHYQFVTIHPYYDGNGRTARLLATFLLHRGGYGLNGYLSLEESHAHDLEKYYGQLETHPHHNYYFGREKADLTKWVEYFLVLVANVFKNAKEETLSFYAKVQGGGDPPMKNLDPRLRVVLGHFGHEETITSTQSAKALGLSDRMVRLLLANWVRDGILVVANPSNRKRAYGLSAKYRQLIGKTRVTGP
jgi:Fic family protein